MAWPPGATGPSTLADTGGQSMRDALAITVFVVWLMVPPLYMVLIGRAYTHRWQQYFDRIRDYVDDRLDEHDEAERSSDHSPDPTPGRHHRS